MLHRSGGSGRVRLASMGPRSADRGNNRSPVVHVSSGRRASMGPRSADRGNDVQELSVSIASDASMGPRSADRGNSLPRREGRRFTCFNGAAISMIAEIALRREGRRPLRASMGPRSADRGNTSGAQPACTRWSSFNGAAISRSRKCIHPHHGYRDQPASMGPRSADRGNETARLEILRGIQLQWGRDQQIAEIGAARSGRKSDRASMGPRSADRGNSKTVNAERPEVQLQWGRDQQIAEMGRSAWWRWDTSRFNGAAISRSRKYLCAEIAGPTPPASMGPRSADRGNRFRELDRLAASRFNGAAISRSRK